MNGCGLAGRAKAFDKQLFHDLWLPVARFLKTLDQSGVASKQPLSSDFALGTQAVYSHNTHDTDDNYYLSLHMKHESVYMIVYRFSLNQKLK